MSLRKATRLLATIVSAALPLGGCLQPMYGQFSAGGPDVAQEMKLIAIDPIPDQFGHYLGDDLIFALNGTGSHPIPKYRLFITYTESSQTPLNDTVTGRPSSNTVVINATYRLVRIDTNTELTKGRAFVFKSYDRTSQRFANIRASRDAEIRDAKVLSDELATRIAAYFATRQPTAIVSKG